MAAEAVIVKFAAETEELEKKLAALHTFVTTMGVALDDLLGELREIREGELRISGSVPKPPLHEV